MKINFKTGFTIALGLLIAACNPQAAQAPETTATPIAVIPSTPLSTVSMDDRLLASIDTNEHPLTSQTIFGDHPEEIIFAKGFIWVHLVNGHLIQVDPATSTMVDSIKVDTTNDANHYCQGLGTDGENIWVCSASGDENHRMIDVVRVDPSSQSVVATVDVGKIFDQLYMPFAQNQIWVLTGDGSKLVGIDVSNNQPSPAIDLGTRCFHLAALGNILYASCGLDNLVIKIDPEKKEILARQTVQDYPKFIFAAENGLWVSQARSISRLDPESLNSIVTISGITSSDINAMESAVWVWEYGTGVLYKIDPATNEVVELIKPDDPFISGGGVLPTSDSVWLTVDENDLLLRLKLND
jgi:DNA-binding beta-propeller fold protein YncE